MIVHEVDIAASVDEGGKECGIIGFCRMDAAMVSMDEPCPCQVCRLSDVEGRHGQLYPVFRGRQSGVILK